MPQQPPAAPAQGGGGGNPLAGVAIFLSCTIAVLGAATGAALCWYRHAKRQEGEGALESLGIPEPILQSLSLLDGWVSGCWSTVRRAVRVDLAAFSSHVGCEGLVVCGDSSDDGEARDGNWQAAVEEMAHSQPQLAGTIAACCTLLDDRRRFENEVENVFQTLRRSVLALPTTSPPSMTGNRSGAFSLEDIPAKLHIWDFILRVAEQRRFYRAQVAEVAGRLEQSQPWAKVLARNAAMRRRRVELQQPQLPQQQR